MDGSAPKSAASTGTPTPPTIGESLRRAREARGLSLGKLAQDTRIAVRFLEALERNEAEPFPAEVYLQGSLRSYANALGLDGAALVRRFYEEKTGGSTTTGNAYRATPAPRPAPGDGSPVWRQSIMLIAGLLALLAFVLTRWHQVKPSTLASNPDSRAVQARRGAEGHAAPSARAVETTPLKLNLEAVENTWARIKADDTRVFEGILPEGTTRQFEATTRFNVRVSKALGLILTFQDRRIDLVRPPESGNVKELTLDREGVRLREIRRAISASPASPSTTP